jgi:hypothetical protein
MDSSPNIIKVFISMRMRLKGHVEHMGDRVHTEYWYINANERDADVQRRITGKRIREK